MCTWCSTLFEWIWEALWVRVTEWARDTWRRCFRQKCNWWCLCCNKWFCWVFVILVLLVTLILQLILTILAILVCVPCYLVCIVLCVLGLLFGNTKTDDCIEKWCQGLARESDEPAPIDPQEPIDPNGPLGGRVR